MVENRIRLLDPSHIREDSEEWLTVKVHRIQGGRPTCQNFIAKKGAIKESDCQHS